MLLAEVRDRREAVRRGWRAFGWLLALVALGFLAYDITEWQQHGGAFKTTAAGWPWLLFQGSWVQARINWDVQAPVTGASMAIFYGSGVVFAIAAGFLLLRELLLALTGRLAEDELVMVRESEEAAELEQILKQQAGAPEAPAAGSAAAAFAATPKS